MRKLFKPILSIGKDFDNYQKFMILLISLLLLRMPLTSLRLNTKSTDKTKVDIKTPKNENTEPNIPDLEEKMIFIESEIDLTEYEDVFKLNEKEYLVLINNIVQKYNSELNTFENYFSINKEEIVSVVKNKILTKNILNLESNNFLNSADNNDIEIYQIYAGDNNILYVVFRTPDYKLDGIVKFDIESEQILDSLVYQTGIYSSFHLLDVEDNYFIVREAGGDGCGGYFNLIKFSNFNNFEKVLDAGAGCVEGNRYLDYNNGQIIYATQSETKPENEIISPGDFGIYLDELRIINVDTLEDKFFANLNDASDSGFNSEFSPENTQLIIKDKNNIKIYDVDTDSLLDSFEMNENLSLTSYVNWIKPNTILFLTDYTDEKLLIWNVNTKSFEVWSSQKRNDYLYPLNILDISEDTIIYK